MSRAAAMRASGGGGRRLELVALAAVICPEPRHKAGDAVLDGRARSKAGGARQSVDVGIGRQDIARLHRQVALPRLASQRRLEGGDEMPERDRGVVSDVVESVRRAGAFGILR